MVELYNRIKEGVHTRQIAAQERTLLKEEEELRNGALLVGIMITTDNKLPRVARVLAKGLKQPTPEDRKRVLFDAYAHLHIPKGATQDYAQMRRIFSRGTYQLYEHKSMKDLAAEENLSWREYAARYRRASLLVSDHQIAGFVKKRVK